jgi:hypothetical protein
VHLPEMAGTQAMPFHAAEAPYYGGFPLLTSRHMLIRPTFNPVTVGPPEGEPLTTRQ